MDQQEKKELLELFQSAYAEHIAIDRETHRLHHQFIREEMDRRRRGRDMWDNVKKTVFGWTIIAIITGIGVAVADYVLHIIKNNPHP